jgi:hypothetical protein
MRPLARELIDLKPDVLFAGNTPSVATARESVLVGRNERVFFNSKPDRPQPAAKDWQKLLRLWPIEDIRPLIPR